jgi:hypothetical protein
LFWRKGKRLGRGGGKANGGRELLLLFIMGCNIRAVANDKQVCEEEEGRINRGWHIVCIYREKKRGGF